MTSLPLPREITWRKWKLLCSKSAAKNSPAGKKNTFRRIIGYVFFPFVLLWRGVKKVASRIRIPITVKTTFIYTLLFTVALVLIDVFIVSSVSDHLESLGLRDDGYIGTLILTSAALILISVAVVSALGSLASKSNAKPHKAA